MLTFPVIQALRAHYDNPHITLVSNPAVLPLAIKFGLAEEVSDYGQIQWSELFASTGIQQPTLSAQLRQVDLAICWLRDASGIVKRNLYTAGVKNVVVAPGRPTAGERMHIVDYLARSIGLDITDKRFHPVGAGEGEMWCGDPCGRPSLLQGRKEDEVTIAVHPGSGGAHKCWPVPCFAETIKQLWEHNCNVLVLIGPADHARWAELQKLLPAPAKPAMLKVMIDTPLTTVAEQVQQCRCYLGNDAGITHLAALLGVPTIVLFGPSDPAVWQPVGPSVEIIQAEVFEGLPVITVIKSILKLL
ncbi:MAG: glycosyltransferase family 9 protein [Ktedonobacteraceae bacterium]